MNSEQRFREISSRVRAKPGMYLGVGGPDAIPRVVQYIVQALCRIQAVPYRGPLTVSVNKGGTVIVESPNTSGGIFHPAAVGQWIDAMLDQKWWMLAAACGFCERFEIHAADKQKIATLTFADNQGFITNISPQHGESFIRFVLEPSQPHFGGLNTAHLYAIAGMLKDVSLLHPGLATKLSGDWLQAELRYLYQEGFRSFLFEEDHSRFSISDDCVEFAHNRDEMKIAGCLRFVHAGNPHVRSYVNFLPTQGGAHLEGVGKALGEIFPDAKRGCRPLMFITNSNTGAHVHVPHSFIGVLHLQTDNPRFDGPTKDILLGDDVREFVYAAVLPKLSEWQSRRAHR
jgi:DNA gyrase/topoisomerase IV subunit B